jgi:predicted transcriptional regulator
MKQDILVYLFTAHSASAGEIAQGISAHPREVQDLLIEMDDDNEVIMRNGFYRLSELSRAKAIKKFDELTI